MPTYNVKNKKTGEEVEVICSWNELQEILSTDPDLVQGLATPSFSGAPLKDNLSKAGTNWKDLLGRIKKGSGRDNKINT